MYGKHFETTYTGSMYGAGVNVFAVWGYVIAHTRRGIVELNPNLLAAVLGCKPKAVETAIDFLCQEDLKSRSKIERGCRLVRDGEFSYRVPTYDLYQGIRNEDERKEYMRKYMKNYRKGKQQVASVKVNNKQCKPPLAHTDTDTDTDLKTCRAVLDYLNKKTGRNYQHVEANLKLVKARLKEYDKKTVKAVIDSKCEEWLNTDQDVYLRPKTLFGAENFAQYSGQIGNGKGPEEREYE